ncbi:hypothetical protein FACS1894152_5260 [Bacilli bacterium]|nr:hypothetical protein FACS1894152_5260 [Bacilli bacterium]
MKKVSELFAIKYGINLELNACEITNAKSGINFVARTAENNGVVARVAPIVGKKPQKAGLISVAGGGSVLSTFVQTELFYSGRDLFILEPKQEMTFEEKLFYCHVIKMNAYRYAFGRQANITLKDIELPDLPDWIKNYKIDYNKIRTKNLNPLELRKGSWEIFELMNIFDVQLSKGDLKIEEVPCGNIPLISSSAINNGCVGYVDEAGDGEAEIFSTNQITFDMFGNVFYQSRDFYAVSHGRVSILKPKFELDKYSALFICSVLKKEQYRFSYGRAAYGGVISDLKIKLPVNKNNEPDWQFMEDYIKSLPYGDLI